MNQNMNANIGVNDPNIEQLWLTILNLKQQVSQLQKKLNEIKKGEDNNEN